MKNIRILLLTAVIGTAACSADAIDAKKDAPKAGAVWVSVNTKGMATATSDVTVKIAPAGIEKEFTDFKDGVQTLLVENLADGQQTLTATATVDGEEIKAEATVTIAKDTVQAIVLNLSNAAAAGAVDVTSLLASAAAPLTTASVTLTATVTANGPVAYAWTDNCRGEFTVINDGTATWKNGWAESCEITVTAKVGEATSTGTVSVASKYATGTVLTIAGTYCAQSSGGYDEDYSELRGENGLATSAQFGRPYGMAYSPSGELHFTDREAGRILKIDAGGILRRVGGPVIGAEGSTTGDGGPVTQATMNFPTGLAFDAVGDLYVMETWGYVLRKVYAETQTIFTVKNISGLGLDIDDAGTVYIGDPYSAQFHKFYPATGTSYTIGVTAPNNKVFDVSVSADGSKVYYVTRQDHKVWKFQGGVSTLVAGNGSQGVPGEVTTATTSPLNNPMGVFFDETTGKVYISDTFNKAIRVVGPNGKIKTVAGDGFSTLPGNGGTTGIFSSPMDILMDANRNLIVADRHSCLIRKVVGPF